MADRTNNPGSPGSSSRSDNRDLNEESGLERKEGGMSGSSPDRGSSTGKTEQGGLGGSSSDRSRSGSQGDEQNRNREGGMSGSSPDRGSQNPAESNQSDRDIGSSNR